MSLAGFALELGARGLIPSARRDPPSCPSPTRGEGPLIPTARRRRSAPSLRETSVRVGTLACLSRSRGHSAGPKRKRLCGAFRPFASISVGEAREIERRAMQQGGVMKWLTAVAGSPLTIQRPGNASARPRLPTAPTSTLPVHEAMREHEVLIDGRWRPSRRPSLRCPAGQSAGVGVWALSAPSVDARVPRSCDRSRRWLLPCPRCSG